MTDCDKMWEHLDTTWSGMLGAPMEPPYDVITHNNSTTVYSRSDVYILVDYFFREDEGHTSIDIRGQAHGLSCSVVLKAAEFFEIIGYTQPVMQEEEEGNFIPQIGANCQEDGCGGYLTGVFELKCNKCDKEY